jgi:hypothetical protein
MVAVSGFILLHSIYINWDKGLKYNFVRFSTDFSAAMAIFGAIMIFISLDRVNTTRSAICYDFFYNGVSIIGIQLCDNYIFFNRFLVVQKCPTWKRVVIHAYVIFLLIFTWLPAYTIYPFFFDVNSIEFLNVYLTILLPIEGWAVIAYNFYFTAEFTVLLYRIYSKSTVLTTSSKRAMIIAYKSIIHCFTSSLANLLYVYIPIYGVLLYCIIIVLGLHFLFNFKVEVTMGLVDDHYVRETTKDHATGADPHHHSSSHHHPAPRSQQSSIGTHCGNHNPGEIHCRRDDADHDLEAGVDAVISYKGKTRESNSGSFLANFASTFASSGRTAASSSSGKSGASSTVVPVASTTITQEVAAALAAKEALEISASLAGGGETDQQDEQQHKNNTP